MERLILIGAVTCLVVSWLYIFLLKARVRDCVTHIQNRMGTAIRRLEAPNGGPDGRHEVERAANSSRLGMEEATGPALGRATMDGKPKLIVGGPDSLQPLHYLCSHCLQPFYLRGNQPPKEAVVELLHSFEEHVKREHPDVGTDSKAPAAEADKEDSG
jgi:hypothetical protein